MEDAPKDPENRDEAGMGPADKSASSTENHLEELQRNIARLSQEVETLSQNIKTRKKENTILKIMMYTGFILLMAGFFYSSNALHKAQLESLEFNLDHLQTMSDTNLARIQASLWDEINVLRMRTKKLEHKLRTRSLNEDELDQVLTVLNMAVTPMSKQSPRTQDLITHLRKDSDVLLHSYQHDSRSLKRE